MAKSRRTTATAKSASVSALDATLADIPEMTPAEGVTVREVAQRIGCSKDSARKWVRAKLESGQWEEAGTGERTDSTGRRQRVAVYRKKRQGARR